MKIKHITFTGIDERTNIAKLKLIQDTYPLAEFGVLVSSNWANNGNRYMNPAKLEKLKDRGLNLSCHACGAVARHALNNDWEPLYNLTNGLLPIFNRIQLNVSCYKPTPKSRGIVPPDFIQEVIIQQRDKDHTAIYDAVENKEKFSMLLDASGGHGIDTHIVVMGDSKIKVGYAGGISPQNVHLKLCQIYESRCNGDFWIDMESGVRFNDWFDTDKVVFVLETCKLIINRYERPIH